MNNTLMRNALWITLTVSLAACDSGPKSIAPEGDEGTSDGSTGVFSGIGAQAPAGMVDPAAEKDLHTVVALESLPTTKYVYVRVKEGEKEFWIATTLQEITIGRSYFYRGGLAKTNFESKEYGRTFEELYLISQLVPSDHGSSMGGATGAEMPASTSTAPLPVVDIPGSTKISEILADPKKFAGKTVQVSGTCTKMNPNIMGRNWMHLKDGGKNGGELVLTTDAPVMEGQTVTMIGTVVLDKDFGAGYKYDILMEGGRLVK